MQRRFKVYKTAGLGLFEFSNVKIMNNYKSLVLIDYIFLNIFFLKLFHGWMKMKHFIKIFSNFVCILLLVLRILD